MWPALLQFVHWRALKAPPLWAGAGVLWADGAVLMAGAGDCGAPGAEWFALDKNSAAAAGPNEMVTTFLFTVPFFVVVLVSSMTTLLLGPNICANPKMSP